MTVKSQKIRLGTRGSPLALKQVEMVRAALAKAVPDIGVETIIIKTSGDWNPAQGEERLLESAGGKGQFAKEIEAALLAGEIDAGVHSMKDMETYLPAGLVIDHMLPREDARDCFIFNNSVKELAKNIRSIDGLPEGITIGTSSVRRGAFLLSRRPDLKIVSLRGNVGTRIEKLRRKEQGMEAIILAYAGLKRLGLETEADLIIEPEDMLPSAGQGAVGIEILKENQWLSAIFSQISCQDTILRAKAERAALAILDGSCHTPIGAYATLENEAMNLRAAVSSEDGRQYYSEEASAKISTVPEAEKLGAMVGQKIRQAAPNSLFGRTT